ncbi:MAG: phosphatidylserine decarboxylase family protein [Planctomycetes bacterium]|nr:phosphatidylserine decarboxylase family protein [Planctomycetota bacterium]
MLLTPYGIKEWLIASIIAAAISVGLALLGWWWAIIVPALVWLAVLAFFRDPWRRVPDNTPDGLFISPADGCVSSVETVEHHQVTDGPAIVIRIFLSVLNVHVNRSPSKLEVLDINYSPGKFHDARSEKCPIENESNLITLRTSSGETVGVRQIAGKLARRIVCKISPGDKLELGQKFGMIKFGSSTELILPRPDDVKVHVSVGQKVRGGLSPLAMLKPLSQEDS